MFFEIELLILILMLAVFLVSMLVFKLPTGICLMIGSIAGMLLGTIFSGTDFDLRFIYEGAFGYLDTILTICFAMLFVGAMQTTGILDYFCTKIVKLFGRVPTLLIIVLAVIVMFPAMVTGTSICSVITTGVITLPILINWGVPKKKAAAFIVAESVLGEICPPINISAMVICDTVDIAFRGFELPLLALAIPCAIFLAILLVREHVKPIEKEDLGKIVNLEIEKELNFTCLIPLIVVVGFIIAEIIWPKYLSIFGVTLVFAIAALLSFIFGKRIKFFNGFDDKNTVVGTILDSVKNSLPVMGILMGIGIFMAIIALNGVRGYLAVNCILLPKPVQIALSIIALPVFGGVSPFGSASIFGPAFVMSFAKFDPVVLVCGFSLLACVGDFLPPSALPANYMAEKIGEKDWKDLFKPSLSAIIAMVVSGALFSFVVGKLVNGNIAEGVSIDVISKFGDGFYFIVMGVFIVLFGITLAIYYSVKTINKAKELKGEDK